MTGIWVDTDFGFDDLWAFLLLRHLNCAVSGVSLVAGNAPLPQVAANALGAIEAYGFDWPVWQGAARPLRRPQETAERILGPKGMQSRGRHLPQADPDAIPKGAVDALSDWLGASDGPHTVLALGPLTNIAQALGQTSPRRDTRLVWMGGSAGPGNHSALAEFNALADAEALEHVLRSGVQIDIVELTFCRQILFAEIDMPAMDDLTGDLLGGYLDIGLSRGRSGMAIYDPLAALAVAAPETIRFSAHDVIVSTEANETYGATRMTEAAHATTRIATKAQADLARICLGALEKEAVNGPRH